MNILLLLFSCSPLDLRKSGKKPISRASVKTGLCLQAVTDFYNFNLDELGDFCMMCKPLLRVDFQIRANY